MYRGDGLNLYAYVANNPVNYEDPSGYSCESKGNTYSKDEKPKNNNKPNTYPPRTPEAQAECQTVVDTVNKLKGNQTGGDDKKNPVAAVFVHQDGTVSVGISGNNNKTVEFASQLQAELNMNSTIPNKYTVFGKTDYELKEIMERSGKGTPGNILGACAEPKAASAANKNTSQIIGMDTRWRFPEEVRKNNHKYSGSDKTSDSQMNPCDTCKAYESEYMEYANANKKK